MAILDRNILKSFYETGDKPTQAQFAALIDSNFNLNEDHYLLGLREYSESQAYLVGDSVIYNGAIYLCSVNTGGVFNPSDWNKIAGSTPGAVIYKGTWNADTNTPDLQTISAQMGEYYVVSVAGNTNLDGITDWNIGDWAIYNGTVWEKVDNSDGVTDAKNVNEPGIGIFKSKTGTVLKFKRIQNNDGSVSIVEDASEKVIDFGINFEDSGTSALRAWSAQKINSELTTKANKVSSATANNFASLDGTGNLLDSGKSASSFLASTTVAADIPVTPAGNITATNVQAALVQLDTIKEAANPNIQAHIANMSNPHNTTKAQVGLANVTNDQQLSQKSYQMAEANQSTSSALATALSFNFTPTVAGNYLIEWYFELSKSGNPTTTITGQISLNSVNIGNSSTRFNNANEYIGYSGFKMENLPASSQAIAVSFGVESGNGGAIIRRVRVKITKV